VDRRTDAMLEEDLGDTASWEADCLDIGFAECWQ